MSDDAKATLTSAARAFHRAEQALKDRREVLTAAIRAADAAGVRQVDIVQITGYAREHVRRILRSGPGHDPVS